jgi:hypothetical protein
MLSNRLLLPPDGITLNPHSFEQAPLQTLGQAWMALPLHNTTDGEDSTDGCQDGITGPHCWTLFLKAANFQGAVAYWVPQLWSALSAEYRVIVGPS